MAMGHIYNIYIYMNFISLYKLTSNKVLNCIMYKIHETMFYFIQLIKVEFAFKF